MDTSNLLTIYNLPTSPPVWDRLGVFYIAFCATWTAIVVAGMAFCLYNQRVPLLRVRCLPLSFTAITFLHLYWILAQCVYPLGRAMPALVAYDVQYFVMGIFFPLGIAMFHAANLRFLRVAELQQQFVEPDLRRTRNRSGLRLWLHKACTLDTPTVMTIIGTGMVFQTVLCIGMWLMCKKYHPSFGVHGTEISGANLQEQLIDLGRGWEWWPSVFWQLVWTWIVAPVLIWQAWDIRDTLGWRTQTIGACLSGLPAIPMFLIASYVPAFQNVNMYFGASQWIHLNTFFIEIFTIFVPAYHVLKLRTLKYSVNHTSSLTSTLSNASTSVTSINNSLKRAESSTSSEPLEKVDDTHNQFDGIFGDHILTMSALERFLDEHPMLLQCFSANSDFSGENIAFLERVAKWKSAIPTGPIRLSGAQRPTLYASALEIYIDLVSAKHADFPVNLSSRQISHLEAIFEDAARLILGDKPSDSIRLSAAPTYPPRQYIRSRVGEPSVASKYAGPVPTEFNETVFDDAQRSIKRLVLTNTWPKFVMEMHGRQGPIQWDRQSYGPGGS